MNFRSRLFPPMGNQSFKYHFNIIQMLIPQDSDTSIKIHLSIMNRNNDTQFSHIRTIYYNAQI